MLAAGRGNDIKVLSYNIHHGVGLDDALSLERIAQVIEGAGATIVGLQEVDRYFSERSNFEDQASILANLLDYEYTFGGNLQFEPAAGQVENRQYGNAILSKYPIIESENIHLNSFGNEQRGLLRATVNINGELINIFNTHLELDPTARMAQVKQLIEITSSYSGPKVLMGDFNTEPQSEELQLLLQHTNFTDSFSTIENANTFPANNPATRIDFIFTSSQIHNSNQQVIHQDASDHLPIVTKLTLI